MKSHKFVEDGEISGARITSDGYLVADVRCARTGIQSYLGSEFGMNDRAVVRVYRPEAEVFSTDSLKSYANRPATDDHPAEAVTPVTWKDVTVGNVGGEVMRDGEYVRVPLILMDADVIQKVKDGKRQISMGYTTDIDMTPGVTDDGQEYDAVQRNLRMNHLAIVQRGRAGSAVRIGDNWGASPITNDDGKPPMTLKTIVVDGLTVETTDAGAKAIEKLQGDLNKVADAVDAAKAKATTDAAQVKTAHDTAIADKDKELAAKDAEIADLKGQVLDSAALDARVAQRATLMGKASLLAKDADFSGGKSDHEIMQMAVDAVHGEGFSKDKSPAYIEAAFDLAKVPEGDKVRTVLQNRQTNQNTQDHNGYDGYVSRIGDAWKTTVGGQA